MLESESFGPLGRHHEQSCSAGAKTKAKALHLVQTQQRAPGSVENTRLDSRSYYRFQTSCRPAYLQILIIISLAETYLSKICFKTLNDGRISRGAGRFDSTERLNTVSDAGALVLTFERPGSVWRRPGGGTIRIGVLHYGTYQSLRQRNACAGSQNHSRCMQHDPHCQSRANIRMFELPS